jgi:hypothetical protein
MDLRRRAALFLFGLALSACAVPAGRSLVDPFPLRFPLVEAGTLEIEGRVVGQPWSKDGVVYLAASDATLTAVVVPSRSVLWRRPSSGGPVEAAAPKEPQEPVLRIEGDRLQAFSGEGERIWEFKAPTAIAAAPALAGGHFYFGDSERMFYCLDAATGQVKWRRRLQGAPLHPAVVAGGTVVVAASNSVVYFLSARGGSILSWETVPSRVVYPLAAAGPFVLVSSASQEMTALEIRTRKRIGQYLASGPLVAGAVWSPPYIVLVVEDRQSHRQRIVFLRSQ